MTISRIAAGALLLACSGTLLAVPAEAQSGDSGHDIVSSFDWWAGHPDGHHSKTEQAYAAGMLIQRLRDFFEDDTRTTLINWGAGPNRPTADRLDERELPAGAGVFGVFVAFPPADRDLYQELLPDNFSMPDTPVVSLAIVDYNQPNPVVRYKEGMVMLKAVAADGRSTWYVHAMPVEDWLMLAMGHDWGFRKELFDMQVTKTGASAHRRNGDLFLSLQLTEQPWGDHTATVPEGGAGGINNMAVVYPSDTDLALVFASDRDVRPLDRTEAMVTIEVGEGLDWAGLVPESGRAPGYYQRHVYDFGDSYIRKSR